jgi:hypothetical protein
VALALALLPLHQLQRCTPLHEETRHSSQTRDALLASKTSLPVHGSGHTHTTRQPLKAVQSKNSNRVGQR